MSGVGGKLPLTACTLGAQIDAMFEANPKARADLTAGTVYAVTGDAGWLYYGQVTSDKAVGFFRYRGRNLEEPEVALAAPIMSVVNIAYPSITRALRSGKWRKLGRVSLVASLTEPRQAVQWSVGTLSVVVWSGAGPSYETRVEDPDIQSVELMASWDAEHHIPARLTADFGAEEAEWHVGGPVWRERRVKEEYARRFPDAACHQLPPDWVPTSAS